MHYSTAVTALGLVTAAVAAPAMEKRQTLPTVMSANDESVLQLALYLEHLEFSLYTGGYENFTDAQYTAEGFPSGFRDNVGVIAQHEQTHADTITAILTAAGKSPVPTCSYKFPYNDPTSFVDLANMITSVGIGAYLGGATLLMDNPDLLTAASSILTIEARHDSYLRAGVKGSPFPNAFDTSLTAVFAYNLAQMFIVSCPQNLPLTVLPTLTLTSPAPSPNLTPVAAGTPLQFSYDPSKFFTPVDASTPLYIAFINQVANITYTQVTSCGTNCAEIPVPEGKAGAAFAVLTTFDSAAALNETALTNFGALTAPAEVILS